MLGCPVVIPPFSGLAVTIKTQPKSKYKTNSLMENAARTWVARYYDAYANRPVTTYAFLPCAMSTSGRIHREILRLLYILADRLICLRGGGRRRRRSSLLLF